VFFFFWPKRSKTQKVGGKTATRVGSAPTFCGPRLLTQNLPLPTPTKKHSKKPKVFCFNRGANKGGVAPFPPGGPPPPLVKKNHPSSVEGEGKARHPERKTKEGNHGKLGGGARLQKSGKKNPKPRPQTSPPPPLVKKLPRCEVFGEEGKRSTCTKTGKYFPF